MFVESNRSSLAQMTSGGEVKPIVVLLLLKLMLVLYSQVSLSSRRAVKSGLEFTGPEKEMKVDLQWIEIWRLCATCMIIID